MPSDIQLFVPRFRVEECLAEIRECLERGWTGLGYKTVQFEEAWKQYTELPHAHFLSSATAGLHLAVKLLKDSRGWHDGDEIITTPLTFVSTNHVIAYERMTPVFADVDEYLCLDPDSVEALVRDKTRAVMFVGVGGGTGRLDEIASICDDHNLALIIDGAHMAGTRLHGVHVGPQSDAIVFSFQAVKNLPTCDAGMVCFAESELDKEARVLSWLGIDKDTYSRTIGGGKYRWRYDVRHLGYKYHGNSLAAALGLVGLRYLDQDNAYRRQLANWYDDGLADVAKVYSVGHPIECESSRHLYQILSPERDALMSALNKAGIFPGVHYTDNRDHFFYRSLLGRESGAGVRTSYRVLPNIERVSDSLVSLPMHLHLRFEDVARICEEIAHFHRQVNA